MLLIGDDIRTLNLLSFVARFIRELFRCSVSPDCDNQNSSQIKRLVLHLFSRFVTVRLTRGGGGEYTHIKVTEVLVGFFESDP